MSFIDIGFGNIVNKERIITVVSPDSSPVKRTIGLAKENGMLIDASCGKSTKSVVIMDSGHVILSSMEIALLNLERCN